MVVAVVFVTEVRSLAVEVFRITLSRERKNILPSTTKRLGHSSILRSTTGGTRRPLHSQILRPQSFQNATPPLAGIRGMAANGTVIDDIQTHAPPLGCEALRQIASYHVLL